MMYQGSLFGSKGTVQPISNYVSLCSSPLTCEMGRMIMLPVTLPRYYDNPRT